MVRGKFTLFQITQNHYSPQARTLVFNAVCNDGTPENERFHKASPSGTLTMTVDNPEALAKFELGKSYYLDFSPVPVPA